MSKENPVSTLRKMYDQKKARGVVSVCSAHPIVIEAALRRAKDNETSVLIEATSNQVNQDGGYTGMTPADFKNYVFNIAARVGLSEDRILLGGDHLGPNPWKHLPPEQAMKKACDMIAAYARAGFTKLHLDASMGCAGEEAHLADDVVASRAVMMAISAEAHAPQPPQYVIGTEIPTPGGATEALDHLAPTTAEAVKATYEIHKSAFIKRIPEAWPRVVAIVVQPGVEFGHEEIVFYQRAKAKQLVAALGGMSGLVYEAHSTDYQTEGALSELVQDGFGILKVGPALTFALREALYGLDAISQALFPEEISLQVEMEQIMLAKPNDWQGHYQGDASAKRLMRHYSYSDRIRYYWSLPEAQSAVTALLSRLASISLPRTLISQYLPRLYDRVIAGDIDATPKSLLLYAVQDVLDVYGRAAHETN